MKMFLAAMLLALVGVQAAENDSTRSAVYDSLDELKNTVDGVKGLVDGVTRSYLETQRKVNNASRLKISGYIQTEWQYAGSDGIPSRAGGNFPSNVSNWNDVTSNVLSPDSARYLDTLSARQRFLIRRARIKTTYDAGSSKMTLEIEALPSGMSIKDANIALTEPWLNTFSATLGIMDRPFGFEVPYSSSSLETPERSRMAQTVFPGEKDLGAKLEVHAAKDMGFLQYLNLKGGVFTGMGGNTPNFDEVDNHVDFIGRAGFQAPFSLWHLELDGGFSAYLGKVVDRNDTSYSMKDTSLVLTLGSKDRDFDRTLYGVDAQIYYDVPVIGGFSLRGEYVWGRMPGTLTSNMPYSQPVWPTTGLFERNMEGWYVTLVQNIGTLLQAVLRYDVFDPNTDATGSDVVQYYSTDISHPKSPADLKFSTLGFGLNYNWDEHLRFTAYYDIVTNEKASAANPDSLVDYPGQYETSPPANPLAYYKKDLNDNVFTFRAQFKF